MRHKRIIAIIVVCVFVALAGIGLFLHFFQNKPTVLSAATTKITPTEIPLQATLEVLQEPVYVMFPKSEAPETARTGMTIPQGTIVTTGTTGRAQIMYPGGTVTRLDNSTHVKLSTLDTQKYQIVVDIFQGRIWSRIKKLLGTESYETKTSNTVATVRGTSYEHSVTELDEDSILVLEGDVDFECNENKSLKTSLAANKKALVHCKTDTELTPQDITENDLKQEWVEFNKIKNKDLEDNLKKGNDPAAPGENSKNENKEKNKDTKPTDTPNTRDQSADTKDKGKDKDKDKKNPSPTSSLPINPTNVVGTVDTVVDTVVSAIPTLPPLLQRATNTPVPPTQAPAATATPDPGINVNVDAGLLNVGVGGGKDGIKLKLGNGR